MAKTAVSRVRGEIGAIAEQIRAEIAASNVLGFRDWCHTVSPGMRWDWPHLAFIRARLEPRITALDGALHGEPSTLRPRHLILSVPPRHGKSEQVTIRLPAFLLERWPQLRVIVGAYNAELANKFSRKTRRIADQRMTLSTERNAANDWETVQEGGVRAVGVGGGVTGHGAHLIVIDDPVKSREEAESAAFRARCWDWFTDDLYTRLEPGGVIILIMTRWHEDDLVGRIQASDFADDFEVVNLPAEAEYGDVLGRPPGAALCPDRFNEEALARLRLVLGRSYHALYQGRPTAVDGDIIRLSWFKRFKSRPRPERIILSWDTAQKAGQKNDYSTCGCWYETRDGYFLVDQLRSRLEYPELKRHFFDLAVRWNADVILLEDKGHGTALGQEARAARDARVRRVIMIDPEGDKVTRMSVESAALEAGLCWLPESAPWLAEFEAECTAFPAVAHDDQVDQMSQFLRWIRNPTKKAADYRSWRLPWL
jgi:predicted phage terminase large subunit-like protein